MVIEYAFINDERVEVEVANEIGHEMLQIDKDIKNNDRRETRRHQSLSAIIDKSDMLIDKSVDIEDSVFKKSTVDKLYEAISKLKPAEQELIHKLYLSKHPITQAEYAKSHNIQYTTLRKRIERLRQKLKSTIK